MIVVMIESTGMFLALGDMTGRPIGPGDLTARPARRRRSARIIGGIFNTFPYTSFSQNVGLVGVTGVKLALGHASPAASSCCVLGLLPKMAALVESVPLLVLGGAGLVMFGMVAATGIRILSGGRFPDQPPQPVRRGDLDRLRHDPAGGAELLHSRCRTSCSRCCESGILLAAIAAVLLNVFFNGIASGAAARAAAAATTHGAEA